MFASPSNIRNLDQFLCHAVDSVIKVRKVLDFKVFILPHSSF